MSYHLPEPFLLESILLRDASITGKGPESECLARGNPETTLITVKPQTASHIAEQSSWVPLPRCSLPGRPFPKRSLALSARVSPRTIHFRVLDKSPLLAVEGIPPSCNKSTEDTNMHNTPSASGVQTHVKISVT